jgi:hypothetical protein
MPGAQVIELLVSWIVTTALTFAVVIIDERLISDERLERAWTPASRAAAIVAFGPLALPFHFAKTRGSWSTVGGLGYRFLAFIGGFVAAVVVAIVSSLLLTAIAWALGLPLPD